MPTRRSKEFGRVKQLLRVGDTVLVRKPPKFEPILTDDDWRRDLAKSLGWLPQYEFQEITVTHENIQELQDLMPDVS